MSQAKYKLLPPSVGVDKNWHVVDDADTCVAHCYGFSHSISGGEAFARRIVACLNACHGMDTNELEDASIFANQFGS
jgi:hypothetical protein